MSKVEFDKLKSKDDWRRQFAVWAHWNANGEYVTNTVPPGKGLYAWEGVTASQRLKQNDITPQGGAIQIVIDPADFDKRFMEKRQLTGWKYDDLGNINALVGVPTLMNKWDIKK